MRLFFIALFAVLSFSFNIPAQAAKIPSAPKKLTVAPIQKTAATVPFYSQFKDISSPQWQKVGCGVTSLAMVIDYYKPDAVSVNTLLKQGIQIGAYLQNAGWSYNGLIALGHKYDLNGNSYDLSALGNQASFAQFKAQLEKGPVIASVHYKFDPKSTIPHLVVINKLDSDTLYYNDPAAKQGDKTISVANFMKGWKKRFIVIRPTKEKTDLAMI